MEAELAFPGTIYCKQLEFLVMSYEGNMSAEGKKARGDKDENILTV